MKLLLLAFVALILSTTGSADTNNTQPHVTVSGTAITEAKPDILRWHVTLSNRALDVAEAADVHAQSTAVVLRFLAERGIRSEDMQTSSMRLSENREYRGNSWVKDGYIAATSLSFKMTDPMGYRAMWLGLARLSGVTIERVDWDVSNRIAVQNSTRLEALKKAKAKAEEMAAGLGVRIVEPLEIEEVDTPWMQSMTANSVTVGAPSNEDSGDSLAPGSVPIRMQVRVSFRLSTP